MVAVVVTLFDYDEPPVKPVKRRTVPAAKWDDLRASNHKCDDCLKALIDTDGHGPLARKANVRRRDVHGSDLLLCYAHAQPYRDEDERLKKVADANA
jgi:hypothetical protein